MVYDLKINIARIITMRPRLVVIRNSTTIDNIESASEKRENSIPRRPLRKPGNERLSCRHDHMPREMCESAWLFISRRSKRLRTIDENTTRVKFRIWPASLLGNVLYGLHYHHMTLSNRSNVRFGSSRTTENKRLYLLLGSSVGPARTAVYEKRL